MVISGTLFGLDIMELPHSIELNELNRILIAAVELADQHKSCSVSSVKRLSSSLALGGRPFEHTKTLKLCSYAGLLLIEKGRIKLTELGQNFLVHNPDFSYEITEKQKIFIAKELIFNGPWRSRVRNLFLAFSPNYSKITYELSQIEKPLPVSYNSAIHLLRVLGVLVEDNRKLTVTPGYVAIVNQILADRRGISEESLEQALQVNRKIGAQAEQAVVEFERKRLRALGRDAEADLVRKISELDTGAGYDVESFDGDKPLFDYDRFIEVKASQESELRFYWSANQLRVAREKGDMYWIYFIGGFPQKRTSEITPIMIQNPAARLSKIPQLSVEVATYIISECDKLPLRAFGQKTLKGLVL